MRPCPIIRRSRRGFTLVELLLAAAVSAMILVEVGAMFFYASRHYQRSNRDQAMRRQVADAVGVIAADLACLQPVNDPQRPSLCGRPRTEMLSAGHRPWMRLLRTAEWRPGSRRHVVDYFLFDDDDECLLVRRGEAVKNLPTAAATSFGASSPGQPYEVLARSVESFNVAYYDRDGFEREDWPAALAPQLPLLVKVELTIRDKRTGRLYASSSTSAVTAAAPEDSP